MYISDLYLNGLRSFHTARLELSPGINILVGTNNAGKSTILKSILQLQYDGVFSEADIRKKIYSPLIKIIVNFKKLDLNVLLESCELKQEIVEKICENTEYSSTSGFSYVVQIEPNSKNRSIILDKRIHKNLYEINNYYEDSGTIQDVNGIFLFGQNQKKSSLVSKSLLDSETKINGKVFSKEVPKNLLYPYLSSRKANMTSRNDGYTVKNIEINFTNLHQFVERLSASRTKSSEFLECVRRILNFDISGFAYAEGRFSGLEVDSSTYIPIEFMGDGVPNILALICYLVEAKNKIFLIEELENDIEPRALKKILDLIVKKSTENQFIISTHSNIVLKYLASVDNSKIFDFDMKFQDNVPTTTIKNIEGNDSLGRLNILERLGYELKDFDLNSAWLILEESSAERIINDLLIPNFTPNLQSKLRTFSAGGLSNVEPRFHDLLNLFKFIHLQGSVYNREIA